MFPFEGEVRLDFSAKNDYTCTRSLNDLSDEMDIRPWDPQVIRDETTFSVRIGPAGGKRGYTPITGQPSWGIAWYINDMLIPDIYVIRGETYTFTIEGGNDRTNPARLVINFFNDTTVEQGPIR